MKNELSHGHHDCFRTVSAQHKVHRWPSPHHTTPYQQQNPYNKKNLSEFGISTRLCALRMINGEFVRVCIKMTHFECQCQTRLNYPHVHGRVLKDVCKSWRAVIDWDDRIIQSLVIATCHHVWQSHLHNMYSEEIQWRVQSTKKLPAKVLYYTCVKHDCCHWRR